MDRPIIEVNGLGKLYRLNHRAQGRQYKAMRDVIAGRARNLRKFWKSSPGIGAIQEDFWALRNVEFHVNEGEVLGVIGRNGAGKSTLLKILSRIVEPTEGRAVIRGRLASLLEVGTGFHPELTGRENIFLNGAILGMSKTEIKSKFDEIVAFAEVEQFLDTPTKRYSSGMYVRLAFAVAAHLDPEILIVDEVLAVGDAGFQRKCLGRMKDVAAGGRTVLFVSHSMPTVLSLCSRCLLIDGGRVHFDGAPSACVDRYLRIVHELGETSLAERLDRQGNGSIRFTSFTATGSSGGTIQTGEAVVLRLCYQTKSGRKPTQINVHLGIHDSMDVGLLHLSTDVTNETFDELPETGWIECLLPGFPLLPGKYPFNIFSTAQGEIADWVQNAGTIEVTPGDFFGSGRLPPPSQGQFVVAHSWRTGQGLQ